MVTVSTIAISCALALVSLGGGFYEVAVVDPSWPRRLDLIQPARGGISRRRFWIPAHVAFEVTLLASLAVAWPETTLRSWLLLALGSHLAMRVWSAFDFIPKALAFERVEPATAQEEDARRWTRRSRLRLPLDLVTCGAMMAAFAAAARLA